MTPTREELELVAEAIGLQIAFLNGIPYWVISVGTREWHPTTASGDSRMVQDALRIHIRYWISAVCAFKDLSERRIKHEEYYTDNVSLAVCTAVWKVAVQVARERKTK